ncbi:MAG: NAD(P)-binding protein, partial [Myxococcota bacterium]|nr:NAD(P)-binding protein [Myxococcota bacterium]
MRTAVVGAGLSGLALAHALRARGEAVALFDKGRAPGGRVSTRRVEDLAFDHGAQYFTCRDPRFERLLADWLAAGVAARWEGRVRSLTRGAVATPREATERYVGAPGMSAITRHLAHDLEVLCGRRVTALERAPQGWRLVADGEELGSFERVVVSVPAPQALPLLAAAPALARRVAAVEMQPCQAALVAFEAPLPLPFEGAFVQDSPLAWVARSLGKPGRPVADCWVLHAGP